MASSDSLPLLEGHVLIVDDNPINQKVASLLLKKYGMTYEIANNGQEAVNAATSGKAYDLILMDLNMPVLSGIDATSAIRKWEKSNGASRVPIVVLTGATHEAINDSLIAGADCYLSKPIVLPKLHDSLSRYLTQSPTIS